MRAGNVPSAVLDACVLYPVALRDLLLCAAEDHIFRPLWSAEILTETDRALATRRSPLTSEQRERLFRRMRLSFPEAMMEIEAYRAAALSLPDPDDEHVVACALAGGADLIVTLNLDDFPQCVLGELGIAAVHPDMFLRALTVTARPELDRLVMTIPSEYARPPLTRDEFLDSLARTVPRFAAAMRERR